jgi:hypothetical protein
MVQEQEAEKELQVVMEREVVRHYCPPPSSATEWQLFQLATAGGRGTAGVFHPLSHFRPDGDTDSVAMPPALLFSENFAPLMHSNSLPRR